MFSCTQNNLVWGPGLNRTANIATAGIFAGLWCVARALGMAGTTYIKMLWPQSRRLPLHKAADTLPAMREGRNGYKSKGLARCQLTFRPGRPAWQSSTPGNRSLQLANTLYFLSLNNITVECGLIFNEVLSKPRSEISHRQIFVFLELVLKMSLRDACSCWV